MLAPLPIDPFIGPIVDAVRRSRALVVSARPGAGKTTRVPPALVEDGRVILLQPRRVAARAIAARIAEEREWTLGREVGWQVRFERRFGPETRLLVVTEGVLTSRLQIDPLLTDFHTIVLDEFHERSIHLDLAIALAKQAWRARADLRVVVMSATLDTQAVSSFLDGCPVADVPGRLHPITVSYAAEQSVADAALDLVGLTTGDVLCFLPGAAEIRRAIEEIAVRVGGRDLEVVPLHGSLDAAEQDRAFRPSTRRRIVVSTNIAETSVTVPKVTGVVDSGFHKVARYDAGRAIDSLQLERITADAAEQRAGRAGRVAPGLVRRLWDPRQRLRPHREPDIHRIDLCGVAMDVIAWGAHPGDFEWFETPPARALDAALALLARLGLIVDGKLTAAGDQVRRLPLHPRLARMLVAAGGAREMARACAIIAERPNVTPRAATTSSDLLSVLDSWSAMPPHVQRAAHDFERRFGNPDEEGPAAPRSGPATPLSETVFRRAVLTGYPDRVAQRRETGSLRLRLASGAGAELGSESGVRDADFLVAIDLLAPRPARVGRGVPDSVVEARVRLASAVDRDWLAPTGSELVHQFDRETGTVKAVLVERYDALILAERPAAPDPDVAARLLANAWLARGAAGDDARLLRRLRFSGRAIDLENLAATAARAAASLDHVRLKAAIPSVWLRALDRDAPETIVVPSGRTIRLDYGDDGGVSASVKLQELFGLAETPRIGPRREPVTLSLLAPNGRSIQLTRDLRGFWDRTYPEVRKELRGRYPRHPWPEDPWTATPTARAKKKGSGSR